MVVISSSKGKVDGTRLQNQEKKIPGIEVGEASRGQQVTGQLRYCVVHRPIPF